jgi:hypothetical protein
VTVTKSVPGKPHRRLDKLLRETLRTDAGMTRFMDALFGEQGWVYDASEDVWVTPNKDHIGPGRGFLVVKRGGDWFGAVLPEPRLT